MNKKLPDKSSRRVNFFLTPTDKIFNNYILRSFINSISFLCYYLAIWSKIINGKSIFIGNKNLILKRSPVFLIPTHSGDICCFEEVIFLPEPDKSHLFHMFFLCPIFIQAMKWSTVFFVIIFDVFSQQHLQEGEC